MSSRSTTRPVIVSALYCLDIRGGSTVTIEQAIEWGLGLSDIKKTDIDSEFALAVVSGVQKKLTILDEIITKAAPRWTHDMNLVDKAVLRAALYELLFESGNVPSKVVISQAVSLADMFASPENRRFVNGVLGTIYREMTGEPSATTHPAVVTDDGTAIVRQDKVAACVFAHHNDSLWIALVHDVWGYWTFPKGSVVPGMTTEESCIHKVQEEIGIPITLIKEIGSNSYQVAQPTVEGAQIVRHVTYFVAQAEHAPLTLTTSGGLDDVRWFSLSKIEKLHMYEDVTQMMIQAIPIIISHTT